MNKDQRNIPINKGNYSLDTQAREAAFSSMRAAGVEEAYRQNRQDWDRLPASFTVLDYPLLVDLELSTVCNLKCPFCYTITDEFKSKVKKQYMDFDLFKKIVDEIAGKVFGLRLSLRGEPTLHPKFLEAISYAKGKGIGEVSTLTNGSNLTPALFEQALRAGIDWITLSFDGIGAQYEKNRYPLKFDEMYERLVEFREIKKRLGKVKPVIKLQTVWPAIADDPTAYYETLAPVCDLLAFNPLIPYGDQAGAGPQYIDDFSCPQLYQRLVVGADGRAMMCANDEQCEHPVGDANHQSIHDIWHGPEETSVRNTHKELGGFRKLPVCLKCYLPRKTKEETFTVQDRTVTLRDYA